jgi:AraC-like DNA-binding protein
MLRGIDTDAVRERLTELMTDERVYRDGEMTLAGLARRLSLTPHQLSEFLNEQMGEGFRDYVSRHRIEEASRILRETPRANIMAVCFRVGFNSKSSFNTAFRKFTGLTPSEYKNRGHGRPGPTA